MQPGASVKFRARNAPKEGKIVRKYNYPVSKRPDCYLVKCTQGVLYMRFPEELEVICNFQNSLYKVREITQYITFKLFGTTLHLISELDKKYGNRVYLQVYYDCPCTKTGKIDRWSGRKWYLSDHMTEDEVVKTAYVAFEAAVKHEVMEGFKFDGKIVFNPHVNFRELLGVSHLQVARTPPTSQNFDV